MKLKRILPAALTVTMLMLALITPALANDDEETLTIEVPNIDARPGDIIEVPITITRNPGVSVIKDLRIDLRKGLVLHFPQGKSAYDNSGTAATWPFIPAKTTLGDGEGMLPVMGRPTAANISDFHIVLNFLDVTLPYSTEDTGVLVTLLVEVTEDATGEVEIRLEGGRYGTLSASGDKAPVLINGVVNTVADEQVTPTIPPENTANIQTPDPAAIVPEEIITEALEQESPHITLAPETGTLITPQMIEQMQDKGVVIKVEYPDGTIVEFNPTDIPTTDTGFDLMELHPDYETSMSVKVLKTAGTGGTMLVIAIILLTLGFLSIAAVIYVAFKA